MPAQGHRVSLEDRSEIRVLVYKAARGTPLRVSLVLGHGAGAGQFSGFMIGVAEGLSARGVDVVTFNFPYMEAGRRVPDPAPRLEACYRDVMDWVAGRSELPEALFIGGKSLGGRIATQVAASRLVLLRQRDRLAGIVALGYPLHPPAKPTQLRTAHLSGIGVPMLVVQGSRDVFGTPIELHAAFARDAPRLEATVHVVDGGDHSLKVPLKSQSSQAQVYEETAVTIVNWMRRVLR